MYTRKEQIASGANLTPLTREELRLSGQKPTPLTERERFQNLAYGGGGGGGGDDPIGANVGDVMFIDYDGTVVRAYSKDDFLALSAMPENPSHEGLVAQGWNWSLADAKAYLTDYPEAKLNIGQMYATESGATEIDIELVAPRLSPVLTICVNGTVTVDWGDNTNPDAVTGSSLETRLGVPHTYSAAGAYTIKIAPVSDESDAYAFYGDDVDYSNDYTLLRKEISLDEDSTENLVYANAVRAIRLGRGSVILGCAFIRCYSLSSVTIPSSVTSIGDYAFQYCYALASVTIPSSVTSIGDGAFGSCYGVAEYHILPTEPPTIGSDAFQIVSDMVIYVPDGSLEAYQEDEGWSNYVDYLREEPSA